MFACALSAPNPSILVSVVVGMQMKLGLFVRRPLGVQDRSKSLATLFIRLKIHRFHPVFDSGERM